MSLKTEILSLIFGALLLFVTFGDDYLTSAIGLRVGNLDAAFGLRLWPSTDVIYPLATIAVFLVYGWAKGGRLKMTRITVLLFLSFLAVLALMILDDITVGLDRVSIEVQTNLPEIYWVVISSVYPIYSAIAFFLFGREHEREARRGLGN